jgi:hypothetical protein
MILKGFRPRFESRSSASSKSVGLEEGLEVSCFDDEGISCCDDEEVSCCDDEEASCCGNEEAALTFDEARLFGLRRLRSRSRRLGFAGGTGAPLMFDDI